MEGCKTDLQPGYVLLLESTLSMEDMLKRKALKRQRAEVSSTSRTAKLLLDLPMNVLSAEIPQLLTPKEALELALTCKDLRHVAKLYPREIIKAKLHHFAKLSYEASIGLVALDYAYAKICGICKREFSGAFSKRFAGLYAHDHCIGNELVSLLYLREEYCISETDLPSDIPIIAKYSREHVGVRGEYPFGKKCVWNKCHEMLPLSWTFEWVLHNNRSLQSKVRCRNLTIKRRFLLASRAEFRKPIHAGGVTYPTHVSFAIVLTRKTNFLLPYLRGMCTEAEGATRVRAVVNRGLALLSRVERELVVLGPLLIEDGVTCWDTSLETLEKVLGHKLASYFARSFEDTTADLEKLIVTWKTKVWNDLRVARIRKLEWNPTLAWVVELRFEDFIGDYLRVWKPSSAYQDIQRRALRLQRSPEFRNSGLRFYNKRQIRLAFSSYFKRRNKHPLLLRDEKAERQKFLHIDHRERLNTTQIALILLGRIRELLHKSECPMSS